MVEGVCASMQATPLAKAMTDRAVTAQQVVTAASRDVKKERSVTQRCLLPPIARPRSPLTTPLPTASEHMQSAWSAYDRAVRDRVMSEFTEKTSQALTSAPSPPNQRSPALSCLWAFLSHTLFPALLLSPLRPPPASPQPPPASRARTRPSPSVALVQRRRCSLRLPPSSSSVLLRRHGRLCPALPIPACAVCAIPGHQDRGGAAH